MNPFKIRRIIIRAILIASTIIAVALTAISYSKKEWATTASAMSVITAVLAIWSSLNLTWKQEDEKQPQISIYIDNDSHKHAYSLVVKNEGGSPAYNVLLNWTKPIYDFQNKIPRFTEFENEYDFVFLPNGTQYSRLLIGSDDFQKLCKETESSLVYEVEVSYTYSPKSKFREKSFVSISLEPFKKRLDVLNDQMDYYFENKRIATHLKSISETLKDLNKKFQKSEKQNPT